MFTFFAAVFRWIGRMFRNAFAVLGTLVALVVVIAVLGGVWGVLTDKGIPKATVLALDARGGFLDAPVPDLFGDANPGVVRLAEGLELRILLERQREVAPADEDVAVELFDPVEVEVALFPVGAERREQRLLIVEMARERGADGGDPRQRRRARRPFERHRSSPSV